MPTTTPRLALVTGGAGFIGRHVARALADDGWVVHGMGHGGWPPEAWRRWGFDTWTGGHVGPGALDGWGGVPDLVVHCAGGASVALSMERPGEDFERSVASSAAVLDFVRRRAPGARLVVPSSAAVYGTTGQAPAREDRPCRPESAYGSHKLMVEQLCAEFGRFHGVASAVVRFFSVYGDGLRRQLLWDGCSKLSRGEGTFAGSGEEVRDWVQVQDAARLLVLAAGRASPACPIVNGGTGEAASVREVLGEVAASLGAPPPAFTGSARAGDPDRLVADPAAARGLGWTPRTRWRDGVRAYCEWFRQDAGR